MLLFMLLININKIVEVRFTDVAPKIDGCIEEIWLRADSAYDFVQYEPYEKEKPVDKTVVYLLQDKNNFYFAFRCYALTHEPITCLGGTEDYVTLYIDPFGSKTTAYYFKVCASGTYSDGWLLDDGRSSDDSWDGVWYRAVSVKDRKYEVEIKIPFKSIRYKKGLLEWGINFKRHIINSQEISYWTEVLQKEGNKVSKFGRLTRVNPQSTGYYFELYPEGFVRCEQYVEETTNIKPSSSLNLKWDLTSQISFNATVLPDFAQIESDPYALNLSRYPIYLSERRPFFLEGKEIYRMSDFGEGKGFFSPLRIFYSRMIGKSLNGEPIPILGGLKMTRKSDDWNVGLFAAYADSLDTEPRRSFGVLRVKKSVLQNSDIGMLFSGTASHRENYNYALGLDGVYRSDVHQFIVQSAISDKNDKYGWAISSGYFGFIKNFLTMGGLEVVHDSFDVNDIGFVPWAGMKKFLLFSGPFKMYKTGIVRDLFVGPGFAAIQELGDTMNWSKLGFLVVNPNFRNNWGFNLELKIGPYYEADTSYFRRGINISVWANRAKYDLNFGGDYCYGYNYNRGFLAYQGSYWFWFGYSIIPRIYFSLSSNAWIEWDTLNTVFAITPMVSPRIDFTITKDITFGIFNEFVMSTPETNFSDTDLISNRLGFLFSWNFQPKSWLYIAFNDYREQDEDGGLRLQSRIGAVKVKYLLYF